MKIIRLLEYSALFTIMNNKIIIELAIGLKTFNKEKLYLINLTWIKLYVIFISDFLEHNSNRIKKNYLKEKSDRFSSSKFL